MAGLQFLVVSLALQLDVPSASWTEMAPQRRHFDVVLFVRVLDRAGGGIQPLSAG